MKSATEKQLKYFLSLYSKYERKLKGEQRFLGNNRLFESENIKRDFVKQVKNRYNNHIDPSIDTDVERITNQEISICIQYMLEELSNQP